MTVWPASEDRTEFGIGVDVEEIDRWRVPDLRLFTPREIAYCQRLGRPEEGFAGRWVAKEAVVKALLPTVPASVRDVEIVRGDTGEPLVHLSEHLAHRLVHIKVSIGHSDNIAVAFAVAVFAPRVM